MARPLSPNTTRGLNGSSRFHLSDQSDSHDEIVIELEQLRSENDQLRQLCGELEQALQEATNTPDMNGVEERMREYEALLESKDESIRQMHLQLQEVQASLRETPAQPKAPPGEHELLALSEELEREKRQLQEDEQALMEQMRQMEMSMARERAEMARQRNDLQRLYGEIRHDLERLERNGAVQSKVDELKSRLQDAATRRGAAPAGQGANRPPATMAALPNLQPGQQQTPTSPPSRGSIMGRLFGGGNNGNTGGK